MSVMKTLIVDDELTTRMVLQEVLSGYGEVHSCVDGEEAVAACRKALACGSPYDLICLDLLMPHMDGLEALQIIRRDEEAQGRFRPLATKVVITTATNDTGTIGQAFRQLCDAYVVKPIDAEELIALVQCLFPIEEHAR
jgi:two-component system, chemotaxis family, chemotaxis protein CheY